MTISTIVLAGGGVLAGAPSVAEPAPTGEVAIAPTGQGKAVPRLIDQRTNPPAAEVNAPEVPHTLGIDGKPTGSGLAAAQSKDAKPATSAGRAGVTGPNAPSLPRPLIPTPTTVNANFAGINQAGGGGAQPSDINASVGPTQILETVNRRVTVFNKTGGQLCTNTLAGWLGLGATNVFDPRTVYDNLNNRFIIVASTTGTAG